MDQQPAEAQGADPTVVLILNPTAGKGRAGRELVHLRTHLIRQGIKADVFLTRHEGDGRAMVEALDPRPGTLVVAAGGDGTVHEVGCALLERPGVSLGVIPMGSGNDYAAFMGMSKDPVQALGTLLDGVDRDWDVGQVGDQPFLNSVGFALSSSVSYHSRQTGALTGLLRYGLAAGRAIGRHRPVRIGLDGLAASGDHWVSLMEVGVGDRCGGGFRLTARADPADGLLDVCILEALPRWRMPLLLPRALRGRHLGHPRVIYEQVPGFRLRLEGEELIHVDGELRRLPRGEHSLRVRPRALRVRLPRARAESLDLRRGEAS
jgi:diacylglycerol kinase (ATP)